MVSSIVLLVNQIAEVTEKVIIDATNSVMKKPEPYSTVYDCLADRTLQKL